MGYKLQKGDRVFNVYDISASVRNANLIETGRTLWKGSDLTGKEVKKIVLQSKLLKVMYRE